MKPLATLNPRSIDDSGVVLAVEPYFKRHFFEKLTIDNNVSNRKYANISKIVSKHYKNRENQ